MLRATPAAAGAFGAAGARASCLTAGRRATLQTAGATQTVSRRRRATATLKTKQQAAAPHGQERSPHVLFMTKMFNSVAAWVVSEIVLVPKLADRVQVPKRERA